MNPASTIGGRQAARLGKQDRQMTTDKEERAVIIRIVLIGGMLLMLQGCVLTKLVSVPMRVTGAVVSIVPGVGNTVHSGIDSAADAVDDVPI